MINYLPILFLMVFVMVVAAALLALTTLVGPKKTNEIATYTSFTIYKGKQILWYPDRKYYLLGKYITDEMLADLTVPKK